VENIKTLPRGKIRVNLKHAPYKIGDHVKVLFSNDSTFRSEFIGLIGEIVHYDYSCNCGQSFPRDPMIGVVFATEEIEEFWKEEIAICSNTHKS